MAGDQAYLKHLNRNALLRLVREHPGVSRADLAVRSGLTKVTVGSLVAELLEEGWLEEGSPVVSGSGRPSIPLALDAARLCVLGAEIGVDYLLVLACDLRGGVLERIYQEVDAGTPEVMLGHLAGLLEQLFPRLSERRCLGLGLGVPGPVDGEILRLAPNLGWGEVRPLERLRSLLEQTRLASLPLVLENEANAAALGESLFGSAPAGPPGKTQSLAYLSLGVGVGSGIVIGGQVYRGEGGLAGEIGHTVLSVNGEVHEAERLIGQRALSRLLEPSGTLLHMSEVLARLERGQGHEAVREVGEYLGLLLVNLIHTFSPSRLVLGGPLVLLGPALLEPALSTLERLALPGRRTQVLVSRRGIDACAVGAAARVLGG